MQKLNNLSLFILVTSILILSLVISETFFNTKEMLYNFYSEDFTRNQIELILENKKKWSWVGYLIVPILILIRTSLVSFCLSVGLFIYDTENKVKFKKLLKIALLGELVLTLVSYFKFFYFYFIKTNFTLNDIQKFFPLSYVNLIDISKIEPWLIYPLQTINLFEISYFFVLVYFLHKLLQNKYWKSFEIVAVSYGTGLMIWLLLIMFITLNIS